MKSILITGCNRGLGLGLIKYLTSDGGGLNKNPPLKYIIATCRDRSKAQELEQIARNNTNVHILEFEASNFDQYEDFAKEVSDIVKEDGLNVLFNNAGWSPKFTRIGLVKPDQLTNSFTVNTTAPIMLAQTLLPLLKRASNASSDKSLGSERAAVINMSSILASIAANTDGGFYPYRCSKAALNMASRSLSVDLRSLGIIVMALHPGWVKTDLGGAHAPLKVEDVTPKIVDLLYNLNENHNGKFYQYDGKQLEW